MCLNAKCTLSHLLSMQVCGYSPSANNRFIDYKDSSSFFLSVCAVLWRKRKKIDLEMSHLYFKFPSQQVATATKVLAIRTRQMSLLQSGSKAYRRRRKKGESNENSSFHYLKCELLWVGFEPQFLSTVSFNMHSSPSNIAILHFH